MMHDEKELTLTGRQSTCLGITPRLKTVLRLVSLWEASKIGAGREFLLALGKT
jgi:hypothetical protein